MQVIIPPVPLGEEFNSTVTSQWLELVRKYLNQPPSFESTADPTTADIPDGTWAMWKNSTSGQARIWFNDGGVLKSTLLT